MFSLAQIIIKILLINCFFSTQVSCSSNHALSILYKGIINAIAFINYYVYINYVFENDVQLSDLNILTIKI